MLVSKNIKKTNDTSSFAAEHVRRELKRLARLDNPSKEKAALWY